MEEGLSWDSDAFVLPEFNQPVAVEEEETGGGGHNVEVQPVVATSIAPSEAIKNKITLALNKEGLNQLSATFSSQYNHGKNPAIPLALMISLQEKGFLKIRKSKQTGGKVGGQNAVQYLFSIPLAGPPPKLYDVGEWHVHWASGNTPAKPGWKTGKTGPKTATSAQDHELLKKLLGQEWGKA